jgi:hypothetical protein
MTLVLRQNSLTSELLQQGWRNFNLVISTPLISQQLAKMKNLKKIWRNWYGR